MITGTVIQTFLLNSECTEEQVSTYVSVLQIVQMTTMLLLSGRMEQLKNIFHSIAWSVGMQILLFITMIWMSINYEAPVERKYVIFFGVSIIVSIFQGVSSVMSYKLPYYVLNMREYGKVAGIAGVISGVVGVAYAGALSYFVGRYPYFKVMTLFSGVGIIFTVISVLCVESYQSIFDGMKEKKGQGV